MENHPRTGNCQDDAKIMISSYKQNHGKKYSCQDLNKFWHDLARSCAGCSTWGHCFAGISEQHVYSFDKVHPCVMPFSESKVFDG